MKKPNGIIDEMAVAVMMKASLTAWVTLEIGMFLFAFVYSFVRQRFDIISAVPIVLAVISLAAFFFAKVCFTKELTKTEGEEDEE